jgi:hypothetical protein
MRPFTSNRLGFVPARWRRPFYRQPAATGDGGRHVNRLPTQLVPMASPGPSDGAPDLEAMLMTYVSISI